MFGADEGEQPQTDGEQFEVVDRFDEPAESDPDAGDLASIGRDASAGRDAERTVADNDDVDPRIRTHFWLVVAVFDVALLAIAVGLTLIFLDGNRWLGDKALVGGLLLFAYGVYRYRVARADIAAINDEQGEGAPAASDDAAGDGERAEDGGTDETIDETADEAAESD